MGKRLRDFITNVKLCGKGCVISSPVQNCKASKRLRDFISNKKLHGKDDEIGRDES